VTTVAVVLAAGAGSRFSGPTHKLLARLGRDATESDSLDTVSGRAIGAARAAGIGPVVVVVGAIDLPADVTAGCVIVRNPNWAEGQATSVQSAVTAAREQGADAVVIGLADQPFVTPDAWRAVAAATSPIAVATYDGVRGNPVRLHESVWSLLPVSGDSGARDLIRLRPELVSEVACAGSSADIDTQEDLDSWT
jgi:molybdenum cofactor cytidylyltransferase